jgi:hypothetical protein
VTIKLQGHNGGSEDGLGFERGVLGLRLRCLRSSKFAARVLPAALAPSAFISEGSLPVIDENFVASPCQFRAIFLKTTKNYEVPLINYLHAIAFNVRGTGRALFIRTTALLRESWNDPNQCNGEENFYHLIDLG